MRLLPHQIYLLVLRGQTFIGRRPLPSPKEAVQSLRHLTGQDFGNDADKWAKWIKENRKGLYKRS